MLDTALSTFEVILEEEKESMAILFSFLSQDSDLRAALEEGNREVVFFVMGSYYDWLDQD